MKQKKKGMQDMHDVKKNEGVNELSYDVLEGACGGAYEMSDFGDFFVYDDNGKYVVFFDSWEKAKNAQKNMKSKDISLRGMEVCYYQSDGGINGGWEAGKNGLRGLWNRIEKR